MAILGGVISAFMAKLISFLKDYRDKVVKRWWSALTLFFGFLPEIIQTFAICPNDKCSGVVDSITTFLDDWRLWIILLFLLGAHLKALFEAWSENNENPIGSQILPEPYSRLVENVFIYIPEKAQEFERNLRNGYKVLDKNGDISIAVCDYFNAYKIVNDYLGRKNTTVMTKVSEESNAVKLKFNENFSQLTVYNDQFGSNKNTGVYISDILPLISNINQNLNYILSH